MAVQFATRVDDEQSAAFKETTRRLGTTPADALRMFIAAFNECQGFPYEVRVRQKPSPEPFDTEEEATAFATSLSRRVMDEAR